MLDTKEAFYVVDNLKIYTWKGKECPKELRKKILVGIDEFLSAIGFKVTAGAIPAQQVLSSHAF